MARYYEETALIEFIKQYTPTIEGETTLECVEVSIRHAPTADVAPSVEVEHWKEEANRYQKLWCQTYNDFGTDEMIIEAKAEAVREIFEEIEKVACVYKLDGDFYIDNGLHAELKKKYTEDK